jgi:hypothetical protein
MNETPVLFLLRKGAKYAMGGPLNSSSTAAKIIVCYYG